MSIHPQSQAKVIDLNVYCSISTLTVYTGPPFPHPGAPQPTVAGKPKRKQVKMAVCAPSRLLHLTLLNRFIRI